jgi:Putative Flp pilus-assembly TadE/G-like
VTPRPRSPSARPRDEGQLIPLMLVYLMIVLTLVVVVTDITAVHLQRNRLYALADAAALNAAAAVDPAQFYGSGPLPPGAGVVPLSDRSVLASVQRFLPGAGAGADLAQVRVGAPTGSPDRRTARVTLTARARLPLAGFAVQRWWAGVPITVTVEARAQRPA